MKRAHRSSHLWLVIVSGTVAIGLIAVAWLTDVRRQTAAVAPELTSVDPPGPGAPLWEVDILTEAGTVGVRLFTGSSAESANETVAELRVALPTGLTAAEPGLLWERERVEPVLLGTVSTVRPVVALVGTLPEGGQLILVDLARDLRLGAAPLPERTQRTP